MTFEQCAFLLYLAFLFIVLIVAGAVKHYKQRKANKAYFKRISDNSNRRDVFDRVQKETRYLNVTE